MSLEFALCQTGWSLLSVVVILLDEGVLLLPVLRLGRVRGSKGAPWKVVKGAVEERVKAQTDP